MAKRKATIPVKWRKLFKQHLPGYDPITTAKPGMYFDAKEAEDTIAFVQLLRHSKGADAGQGFVLEPWQQAYFGALFGWKQKDGTRRYRETFAYVPRKNGKSPMAAAMIMKLLVADGEAGAEVIGAAAEYQQASLIWQHVKGYIDQDAELQRCTRVYKGQAKSIQFGDQSYYKVVSGSDASAHGANLHAAVIDELHTQPNRHLVDVIQTSMASKGRRQPLLVLISTADFDREGSICNEKFEYAQKVSEGVIDDPSFLPCLYYATLEDDWTSEKVWEKANPNIDVSVSRDYLKRECKRAQTEPSYENTFKRLHLNIRTEQSERWLPIERWDACSGEVGVYDGELCYAGIDLSSKNDLSALVLAFPDQDNGYRIVPYFWLPEDTISKRKNDRIPYRSWGDQGLIEVCPGAVIDQRDIQGLLAELHQRYRLQTVGIDPWAARQFQLEMHEQHGIEFVEFNQGMSSMSAATKELERLVLDGKLKHGGHPILRWMASCVQVRHDRFRNAFVPDKRESTGKIDGIVAAVMAIGCGMLDAGGSSVYEERGVFSV